MEHRWVPPEPERLVGLGFYATPTEGVGGQLKERAEGFQVQEISLYPHPDPNGAFTVLRIRSRNWEQHELSERIAQRLGLPRQAISWAGTKDRRAVAERLASYQGELPVRDLGIPGVELLEAYRSRDGMVLGHHFGNAFAIRLGGIDRERTAPMLEATRDSLRRLGGIPNLFGLQRFGEVRPITHLVGRALVRGRVDEAVDLYLTARSGNSEGRGDAARAEFAVHRDPVRALREFPPEFRFERQMLDHLARGHPPERAFRALSRELRLLFVHAYQALLFNRYLSRRFELGLPLHEPVEGDYLLRIARDGTVPGTGHVPVDSDNLLEATDTVRRGRALLAGPLIGYETPELTGRPGALVQELLEAEGITRAKFRLPAVPEVSSAGTWRPLMIPLPPISWSTTAPEEVAGPDRETEDGWWFRFALPKGSYATVLLREFRKEGAVLEAPSPTEGPGPNP